MSPPPLRSRRIEAPGVVVGGGAPPLLIAGPDSLESESLVLEIAAELRRLAEKLGLCAVFKGSYDKANRSSHGSYRGPGLEQGLALLRRAREETGLAVTTDVHSVPEVERVADVVDIIQIPAFLCRQNDLLAAAAATGKVVNIKKGQFLPPGSVPLRVAAASGPDTPGVIVTERGSCFGHGDLVNDFRAFPAIRSHGTPLIFDATHSVQRPTALGDRSGGDRQLIPTLARAAAGAGVDGFFFEVHPRPDEALCDGPSSLRLGDLEPLLGQLIAIDRVARGLDG
ncbi:MAG: 3-deoxy-8-phosphooctulonate synthase [Planctomycetota bacterium]|nr:3-deoxy-8-phosphooctulonate synthase [Planctomycetota bacterium]